MNTRNLRFRSNRVRDIASLYHEELDGMYGSGEVGVFLDMLFEAFLGWDKVRLLTSKEQTIDQSDLLRFHWALEDLKQSRPIQHIIGYTDFCGCTIQVSPDVLVPRPETEEIVQKIIRRQPSAEPRRILDLCTGSGCIAIALAKAFPTSEVTALDYSGKALEIAQKNAELNGVTIQLVQQDLLNDDFVGNGQYDLIVSNPPYIPEQERKEMAHNVVDYDPPMALFVPDDDPLIFYRAIADIARRHLGENGVLCLEIHERLGQETCRLLEGMGFTTTLERDFRDKERMITARVARG